MMLSSTQRASVAVKQAQATNCSAGVFDVICSERLPVSVAAPITALTMNQARVACERGMRYVALRKIVNRISTYRNVITGNTAMPRPQITMPAMDWAADMLGSDQRRECPVEMSAQAIAQAIHPGTA